MQFCSNTVNILQVADNPLFCSFVSKGILMRLIFLFVFIQCAGLVSFAQQNHFIYLQTDNRQSFYVRINEKLYSSSTSGYVVIPKLLNGNYIFSVGFPQNEWPSQNISVSIANKDNGYMLKNFESKGWGLFNMQTMVVIMSNSGSDISANKQATIRTDEFSNTLADVVNTPSIKEIKKEEVVQKEITKPVKPSESDIVKAEVATPLNLLPEKEKIITSPIKRLSELKTIEGTLISYVVLGELGSDTVKIIIPEENTVVVERKLEDNKVLENKSEKLSQREDNPLKEKKSPKFIEIELPNPNALKDSSQVKNNNNGKDITESVSNSFFKKNDKEVAENLEMKMINSDCKTLASQEDFLKVRKKMTAQKSEDEMINSANKFFKQKCYSTEQIKNLSVLFLKDDGKYKFFDSAYPFVHDTRNFLQLQSQLTDSYFISRFQAMMRN